MKSYEMYIFDLDDTLIHTFETVTKRYYPRLAETLGVSCPDDDVVRRHWGGDLAASAEGIFGIPVDRSQVMATLQRFHQERPIEPIEGVQRILEILKKHQKFVGLYSSSFPPILDLCIRNSLPCSKKDLDFIFSTVEQQIAKPSPHIVFVMMEKYRRLFAREAPREQVLVIGDSVDDFLIAKNARVDFAAVLTGPTTRDDFLRAGLDPKWVFPTVKEALTPPPDHGIVAVIKDERDRFLLIQESRSGHQYFGHWSGPHGACEDEDVLEEETVVRESREECAIAVQPLRKLYTRPADTKVSTVSFWETKLLLPESGTFNVSSREVGAIAWVGLEDILRGRIPLYPGTKDFFDHYEQTGEIGHGRGN